MKPSIYSGENADYLNHNPTWHVEDSPWKAQKISQIVLANNLHPKEVVEIGCGAGEILFQLANRVDFQETEFSGYDIADALLPLWERRVKKNLNFYKKNLLEENKKFDLLLMIDVFEHVDDYLGFITKAGELATYKIYHIPLDISVASVVRNRLFIAYKNLGHLHFFMKDTALATIKSCGQEIVDYTYTAAAIEANNSKFRTKFLNVFRSLVFRINPDLAVRLFGGYSLLVLAK